MYRKSMSARKENRHKDSTPQWNKEKGKQVWMSKTHCTFCNRGGHQKANCWKLNLELCPRKEKRIAHVLMKEEGLPVKKEEHHEENKPSTCLFQKWMSQLHYILLPLM
jgi:hypothetical protein